MRVTPIRTALFSEGEDLVSFILKSAKLKDEAILVVSSKIAALAESRTRSSQDHTKLVREESTLMHRVKHVWLTVRDGMVLPNAGIDESNGRGKLTLLPQDSMQTAQSLRQELMRHLKLKNLGVIIADSTVMPLRAGVVGLALGYAGFEPVRDYRGKKDLFGRKFTFSQTNIADGLATAATVVMGEGAEQQPLVVITDAPVRFTARARTNIKIRAIDDMFWPLLKPLWKSHRSK